MSNHLIKIIKLDGEEIHPDWHAIGVFDASRTVCGYALDCDVALESETKTTLKGGVTCPKCLSIIKSIQSIKL